MTDSKEHVLASQAKNVNECAYVVYCKSASQPQQSLRSHCTHIGQHAIAGTLVFSIWLRSHMRWHMLCI